MHECSRCYGCMAKITSDIHHVAHAYANPIVVFVSSATGRAYTMLHQSEWCYIGYMSPELCYEAWLT